MTEPVSLDLVKMHLRVIDVAEDALILSYVQAAREWVEHRTGHILVPRTVTQVFDHFPTWRTYNGLTNQIYRLTGSFLELNFQPVVSVAGIAYTDMAGIARTLTDYTMTLGRAPFRLYQSQMSGWPITLPNSGVVVTYAAGYVPGEEPKALIQAMILLVGHWFENRESVTIDMRGIPTEIPLGVESLCDNFRQVGL